jgi:hypothetical protein
MAAFSVFFCDQERCSIRPVRAMDPEHAIAQVRSQVPQLRRVAAVSDALLEGVDPEQLLQEWTRHGHEKAPPGRGTVINRPE